MDKEVDLFLGCVLAIGFIVMGILACNQAFVEISKPRGRMAAFLLLFVALIVWSFGLFAILHMAK